MSTQYLGYTTTQINLAYEEVSCIEELQYPHPKRIKKISIIHSNLQSLRGIEKFTQLTSLNLKYNNLKIAQQILLIPNKDILIQLNLQGNSIQYYSLCTFVSLRAHGFCSLVMLNNKDYSRWGKNKRKGPSYVKMNQKMDKIEKSMSKTLKRTVKNNVIQKYKFMENIQPQEDQVTSRNSNSLKEQMYSSNQKMVLKQISLGNVNLVKSIKSNSPQKMKGPQLMIHPIEFQQSQVNHIPLTQPTATFASQKQKQNTRGMPFRRVPKFDKSIINAVEETQNFQTEDEQIYELSEYINNNCGRASISRTTRTMNMNNKSAIQDLYEHTQQNIQDAADTYHLKNLIQKSWRILKNLKHENLPLQRHYI